MKSENFDTRNLKLRVSIVSRFDESSSIFLMSFHCVTAVRKMASVALFWEAQVALGNDEKNEEMLRIT